MTAEERRQFAREWMLERAAIIEYEAGVPRKEAELMAVEQWHKMCAADPDL
jgi:hypothetical protein